MFKTKKFAKKLVYSYESAITICILTWQMMKLMLLRKRNKN
jgi:hypothetical protein